MLAKASPENPVYLSLNFKMGVVLSETWVDIAGGAWRWIIVSTTLDNHRKYGYPFSSFGGGGRLQCLAGG